MKRIFISVAFLLVFIFNSFGQERRVLPLSTTPQNISNIANGTSLNSIDDVIIDDNTGMVYDSEILTNLLNTASEIKALNDLDVFEVGFSYLAVQSIDGLESSFQHATSLINSDKYILFCFVLGSRDDSNKLGTFYVNFGGNHGYSEEKKVYLERMIQEAVSGYFNNAGLVNQRFNAESYALQILKSLDDPDNQLDIPIELDNSPGNGLFNEDKSLKRAATFISLSGAPIRLPENAFVKFSHSTDVFGNGQTDGLVFSFKIGNMRYQPYYKYENGVPIFTGYKTLVQGPENETVKEPYVNPVTFVENTVIDEVWFGSVTGTCSIQLLKIKDFEVTGWDEADKDIYFSICRGKYRAISVIWSQSVNFIYSYSYISGDNTFVEVDIPAASGFATEIQQRSIPCKIKSITDTKLQSLYNQEAAEYRFEEINGSIKTILVLPYDIDNSLIYLTDNEAIVNYYMYNKYQGWYQVDITSSNYAGQLTNLLFNTVKSAAVIAGITAVSAIAGQVVIVELGFSALGGTAVEILTEATLWTIEGNDEEARMAIVGGVVAGAVVGILSKIAKAYKAWRAGKNSKIIHSKPSGNDPPEVETIEDLFDRAVLPTNQGGAGLSNAQLNKLQGDFDGKPELITFMFRPGAVKAWKVLDEAGTALKTNVIALGKVDFLKSKGFSDVNLKILGEADDIKVLNFAEGFALRNLDEVTTMSRHSKMMEIKGLAGSGEFSKYQDDINSLMTAKNGNGDFLLQNPDGLSSKVSAMNTSGSGNPFQLGGHDFEIEWALDIANQGKSVRLDASNLPDVLDDVGKHAYELKKLNGTGANSLGTNSKTAVNQIKPTGTGPAPSDYTKNVVIKVNNSDHPHMNATKQDLIEYLQGYNQNSGTPQFPGPSGTLNGIDKFIIKNNTGLHEILGSVIDI